MILLGELDSQFAQQTFGARVAISQGMSSLREDGWRLIREGKTTPEEVLRMTKDEETAIGSAELMADM